MRTAGVTVTAMDGGSGRMAGGVLVAVLVVSACAGGDEETAPTGITADVTTTIDLTEDLFEPADESRPVPTVPPSTIDGAAGTTTPGVVDAAPTIAPPPPPTVDPDNPATSAAPPTTDVVGDPQPNPDTTARPTTPPPTTLVPGPDACARLDDVGVPDALGDETGASVATEVLGPDVCRLTSASVVAEIHFVPSSTVRDDWFQRDGVEPVAEVGGDAVGLRMFVPPGAAQQAGYTIAAIGGDRGVIVAVGGTADARLVAGELAVLAAQAA